MRRSARRRRRTDAWVDETGADDGDARAVRDRDRYDYRKRRFRYDRLEAMTDDESGSDASDRAFLASEGEETASGSGGGRVGGGTRARSTRRAVAREADADATRGRGRGRRRGVRMVASSDEEGAEETPRKSARASSMAARREEARARHAEALTRRSLDAQLEELAREEAEAEVEGEVSISSFEDFIDDSEEEEEEASASESDDETRENGLATRRRTVSFGSRADEALQNDDVEAFKRALARLEDPPRPGLALISASVHNACGVARAFLVNGMRTSGRVEDKTSSRPHMNDVSVALHTACSKGHAEFVHAVRDMIGLTQFCRGRDGGWPVNATGGTLVHSAANNESANVECVKAAIMAESSPICHDDGPKTQAAGVFDDDARGSRTPLMIAAGAGEGWEPVVWELLQDARRTNASRAVIRMHDPVEGCTAMHIAAGVGGVATLRMLIDEVPSLVDMQDFGGSTPLHHASAEGRTESIKLLLERGANRLAADRSGWIPLLYANFHSEREAVMHLLRVNAVEQLESMLQCATKDDSNEGTSRTQVQKVFELLATIPKYYDTINVCIETMKNISLTKSLVEMLRTVGGMTILSATNRLGLLQLEISGAVNRSYPKAVFLQVSVDDPWSDVLAVRRKGPSLLRDGVYLSSKDVTGKEVAAGPGVTREIFATIAKQLCDTDRPQTQLFELDDSHTYALKRDIDRSSRAEELETFGELLAYALLRRICLPIPFSKVFLKRVIGGTKTTITIEELEDVEPQQIKSIRYVQQSDVVEDLCLSFTDPTTNTQVDVTRKNKHQFIQVRLREMVQSIVDDGSAQCIKRGILNLITKESTLELLTPEEFGTLVVGTQEIDVDEWRKHADLPAGDAEQMKWFWNVISRMSTGDRSKLLQFSTGSPLLPVGGFADLRPRWHCSINFSAPSTTLPTAQTCFNILRMAAYPSEDVLEQRLMTALRHGSTGFAFA